MLVARLFITYVVIMNPTMAWVADKVTKHKTVWLPTIKSVVGGTAHLPCDIKPPISGDKIKKVLWFKEGDSTTLYRIDVSHKPIQEAFHHVHIALNGRATLSIRGFSAKLTLTNISVTDAGDYKCRVLFHTSPARNYGVHLTVGYLPETVLKIGSNENSTYLPPSKVAQGNNVSLQCSIKSKKKVESVAWRQNGFTFALRGGTLKNNETFLLHKVNKGHKGNYTCVATNEEGSRESNAVYLDVMYAPVCRSSERKFTEVPKGEAINVTCEVDANPDDLYYSWSFRNKNGTKTVIAQNKPSDLLIYTPISADNYGSLLCTAINNVGSQEVPCEFTLVFAEGCTVVSILTKLKGFFVGFVGSCVILLIPTIVVWIFTVRYRRQKRQKRYKERLVRSAEADSDIISQTSEIYVEETEL